MGDSNKTRRKGKYISGGQEKGKEENNSLHAQALETSSGGGWEIKETPTLGTSRS